ncbi:putative zinc finger protein 66 [Galleria mellonella]|uniref:Zinc finger protein 66 n=1 Tax=Galleria mellonella TaxID=7137 RepID=A0ABM3M9N6_GALME|nr:putative zinc finger protein 66 [Galleria mellonella]
MDLINICVVCLKIDGKLYSFNKRNYLSEFYRELCDETMDISNSSLQLCSICAYLLKKFYNFKKKCSSSQEKIRQCFDSGQKVSSLSTFSSPSLNYWIENLNKTVIYRNMNDAEILSNNINTEMYISYMKIDENSPDDPEKSLKVENEEEECDRVKDIEANELELKTDVQEELSDDIFESLSPIVVFTKEEINIVPDVMPELKGSLETNIEVSKKKGKQKVKQKKDRIEELNIDKLSLHKRRKLLRQIKEKPSLTAKDKQLLFKLDKRYKPLKDLENDFNVQMYLTEEEQLEEFYRRRSDDGYVKAEYKCEICYRGFKEQKLLDTHKLKHEPSAGEYVCRICNIRCATSKLHRTHRDSNHTAKYTCKSCSFVTYSKAQARKHQSWHEGVVHTCQHCQMSFRKHTTLLSHLRLLHPSPHICSVCARSFVSANGLRQHKTVAHKEQCVSDKEGTRCEECDIVFASRNVYTRHVLTTPRHADAAKSIIGCTVCGEQFDTREMLEQHSHKEPKRGGDRVKDLKCSECGEHFTHSSSLYHHFVKAHPGIPYRLAGSRHLLCETCGRTFNCVGSLVSHARSHSGERPFACDACDKTFRTKQTRDKHATRHDLARRHACRVCGNLYSNKTNLFRHKQVHSGIRKHRCDMCDKSFVDGSNLRQHVQGVHYNIRRVRKR